MSQEIALVVNKSILQETLFVTGILTLKYFYCITLQGKARIYAGSRPPEDVSLFPKAGAQNFSGQGKFKDDDDKGKKHQENEARWLRLIQNDLENIPLGLIISWGTLLVHRSALVQKIAVGVFCASRLGHSYAYANALQPARAIFWFGGVVAMLTMVGNGVVGAIMN